MTDDVFSVNLYMLVLSLFPPPESPIMFPLQVKWMATQAKIILEVYLAFLFFFTIFHLWCNRIGICFQNTSKPNHFSPPPSYHCGPSLMTISRSLQSPPTTDPLPPQANNHDSAIQTYIRMCPFASNSSRTSRPKVVKRPLRPSETCHRSLSAHLYSSAL